MLNLRNLSDLCKKCFKIGQRREYASEQVFFTLNQAKRAKANPSQVKSTKFSEYQASQASKEVKKQAKRSERASKQASDQASDQHTNQPINLVSKQCRQARNQASKVATFYFTAD